RSEENIQLIETMYSVTTSFRDIQLRENFSRGELIKAELDGEEVDAGRPQEKGYLDLQEGYIEETEPDTLRISKDVEGQTETIYLRNMTSTNYQYDAYHFPGNEWFYRMQKELPFPVTTSIRMHYKDNDKTRSELGKAKMEFDDQKEQAAKADTKVDKRVSENEQSIEELDHYFDKTKYPSYATSYVFRIAAESKKQLDDRANTFEEKLKQLGIDVGAPFGLQPDLFMELLPGSKQFNRDYTEDVDPKMLAGMMYGASSSIGDKDGFYFAETNQGKSVFIYPELGSKAFGNRETAFQSIGCLVAGATGFGKSMMMNLFTYWAVMCGAYALIVDPKGDRQKWRNGLMHIPPENIAIWTVGESKDDAGAFDPFRTAETPEEGKENAVNIFSFLLNIKVQDIAYPFLNEAFKFASQQNDPCVGHGINYLQDVYDDPGNSMSRDRYEALDKLIASIRTFN